MHRPDGNWINAYSGIKDKLTEKYNSPAWHTAALPSGCRQEEQIIPCLENDSLELNYRWEWPTKQKIELVMGKPPGGDGPVAIRIKYSSPQKVVRPKAGAL